MSKAPNHDATLQRQIDHLETRVEALTQLAELTGPILAQTDIPADDLWTRYLVAYRKATGTWWTKGTQ